MKKVLSILLILVMLSTTTQVLAAPSQWAVEEIDKAKVFNLVPSVLLSDYQKSITREEFSEMVVRLYEAISGDIARNYSENPFSDTINPEILKAYDLGIVKGFPEGVFKPDKTITREEIAVMFFRTLEKVNPALTEGTYTLGFADRAQISIWARNQVGFMSKNGIINGIGSNTFAPKLETTREQAIALVVRTFSQYRSDEKMTAQEIGNLSASVVRILTEYDNGMYGYGSGFFFDTGKIATNYHVIEGATKITIEYDKGSLYSGDIRIAGFDSGDDLAVLTVGESTTKALNLGDSSVLSKGQKVYALGSPIGYKNILTEGIVSGVTNDEIQVTLPLSEGSSGGALLDEYGRVAGITFARMYGVESLGFAIPVNTLKSLDISKNISLEEFNKAEKILNPPRNILADQMDSETVSLSWDLMEADYFLVYKSLDRGETFQAVLNEDGSEKWGNDGEILIPVDDYSEGTRIMFGVSAVKEGVTSTMNHSNYIALFKGMSEEEIFDDLLSNLNSVEAEGIQLKFEGYDVSRTSDNKITRIYAYVNQEGFENLLEAQAGSVRTIAKQLKSASVNYSELIGTDVEMTVLYLGLYNEYPHFLEDNYINPDGIKKDPIIGLWEAEYPLINVANNSSIYLTWFGPYNI